MENREILAVIQVRICRRPTSYRKNESFLLQWCAFVGCLCRYGTRCVRGHIIDFITGLRPNRQSNMRKEEIAFERFAR